MKTKVDTRKEMHLKQCANMKELNSFIRENKKKIKIINISTGMFIAGITIETIHNIYFQTK